MRLTNYRFFVPKAIAGASLALLGVAFVVLAALGPAPRDDAPSHAWIFFLALGLPALGAGLALLLGPVISIELGDEIVVRTLRGSRRIARRDARFLVVYRDRRAVNRRDTHNVLTGKRIRYRYLEVSTKNGRGHEMRLDDGQLAELQAWAKQLALVVHGAVDTDIRP